MTTFRALNLRRFFEHRGRTALSVAGIVIGSSLVVAVLGFFGTLTGSVQGLVQDLAGVATLEASAVSDAGFDEKIFFDVSEVDGVKAAVPMIRTSISVRADQGKSTSVLFLGLDQRAEALETDLGGGEQERLRSLATRPGVFVGSGLASKLGIAQGDTLTFFGSGGQTPLEVLAVLGGDSGELNQGLFAAAVLPLAQATSGKTGRLDSILIVTEDGAEITEIQRSVQAAAGPTVSVDSPAQRAEQAELLTEGPRTGMLRGTGLALTVGAFVIFNTMNMAATERRRELATLRALGGRKRKLLAGFLFEAGFMGLIGSVIGSLFGYGIARELVTRIPAFYVNAVGVEMGFHLPAYAIPVALIAGVGVSVIAALVPGRKAVSVSPVESMRPEGVLESADQTHGVAWVPTSAGLVAVLAGVAIVVWGPGDTGFIGIAVMLAGFIVASYGLTYPLARATAIVAARTGVSGRLAAAAIERSPRRAWATAAAVIVATGMVVAQGGIFNNVDRSLKTIISSLGKVDFYLSTTTPDGFNVDVRLPAEWRAELEALPGVENVGLNSFEFITFENNKVLLQGLESSVGESPSLALASPSARQAVLAGEGAVVSDRFRELYGVGEGDILPLPTPDGVYEIPVVDEVPSFAWERGLITISHEMLHQKYGRSGVSDYMITLVPGADRDDIRRRLEAFGERSPLPVYVTSGTEYLAAIYATVDQINALFGSMTWVVVGAAALAIVNALLISVVERKRELGIMRALGTSRKRLRRMVSLEAAAIGLVGGIAGALVGFVLHRGIMGDVAARSGLPINYFFYPRPAIIAFVVGMAIAVAASLFPARRAGNVNIIEAIGYE